MLLPGDLNYEEIEFVDGTGKIYNTGKIESVVGNEGLSGFITKIKLKVMGKTPISIDMFKYDKVLDLLNQVRVLNKDKEVYFLEFLDKKSSELGGFGKDFTLIENQREFMQA